MPINPVIARIDLVVNGQRQLDRLTMGYHAAEAGMNRVNRASFGLIGNLNNMAGALDRNAARIREANGDIHRFHGNIANLTKSIVLFGVILSVMRMPSQFIDFMRQSVQVGKEWDYQLRGIKSLIGSMTEQEFPALSRQLEQQAVRWGITTQELEGTREIASSLSAVQGDLNNKMSEMEKTLFLNERIVRLARAGFTDLNDAVEATVTAFAAGSFSLSQMDQLFDQMATTINVGRISFSQFNKDAATFLPMLSRTLELSDSGAEKMERFAEAMTLYATASLTLGSSRASVGIANIFRDIGRGQAGQQRIVNALERMRAAGQTNIDIRASTISAMGPAAQIEALREALGPTSPLVNDYIDQMKELGKIDDERAERAAQSARLVEMYFDESRAIKAFLTLIADGGKVHADVVRAFQEEMARGEVVSRMAQEWEESMVAVDARLDAASRRFQLTIFNDLAPGLTYLKDTVRETLNTLVDDEQFTRGDLFDRIGMLGGAFLEKFGDWFDRGGGQMQVQALANRLGTFMGEIFVAVMGGGEEGVGGRAARAFLDSFFDGISSKLPQMLGSMISGDVGRSILSFMMLRRFGLGTGASAVGAYGATQAMGGNVGGLGGQVLATGLFGLGGVLTAASLLRGIPNIRTPIGGRTLGNLFGRGQNEILRNSYLMAMQGMGVTSVRDPATGRYINTGRLGRTRRLAGAMIPANQRLRMGATIGGGLLTAGLGIGTALTAGNDEDRNAALAGTAGSLIGGGVGLLGGPLGALAGSVAGGFAGDWLYNTFFRKQAVGGGRGPEESYEAVSLLTTAMDESRSTSLLEQIRLLLSRGVGGGRGPAPYAASSISPVGLAGPASSFFQTQFGDRQLSSAEALAACGPAAAIFFARAHGRNPTMREAVDIAKSLGWNTNQGMPSIQSQSNLITRMGINNQVSAVDWGALQTEATSGRPSILNIGPRDNFPGHFFQIAGFDPARGFHVGASGTDLRGGSAWMTRQQLEALGPAVGMITASAVGPPAPRISPTASNTEAYIRQIAPTFGIDPDVAVRVWKGEGSVTGAGQSNYAPGGVREPSFGPYQLFMGGGVGNRALAAGIDPRDPSQWQAATKFALSVIAQEGWGQWHGRKNVGVGEWEGINRGGGRGNRFALSGGGVIINFGDIHIAKEVDAENFLNNLMDILETVGRGGLVGQGPQIED